VVRAIVLVWALSVTSGLACAGGDGPGDAGQRELNSVMVGSPDELSAADSETVSAIGLELVALGAPLQEWFSAGADQAALAAQMRAAVDRVEHLLTPDVAPEVRATFEPYVTAWRDLLDALADGDTDAYDTAVEHLHVLDQIRIDRVEDVYGPEQAEELLVEEGVEPTR
jgi:hypothetical protein